jgi:hypothetical protein
MNRHRETRHDGALEAEPSGLRSGKFTPGATEPRSENPKKRGLGNPAMALFGFSKNRCSENTDLRNTFGLRSVAELEQKLRGQQPNEAAQADPHVRSV